MRRGLLLAVLLFAIPAFADHFPIDVALKLHGPEMIAAGTEFTYTIELTTLFPGAAYAVTDSLPPNARFVRAGAPPWNCIQSRGDVTCGNERLESGESSIEITVVAPSTPQMITNTASVQSVSVPDPFLDNNTGSLTTVVYDAAACAGRSIQSFWPSAHATVVGPHVTFRWSAVPSATAYQFYAAQGSSVMMLRGFTIETEIISDFDPGDAQWYVLAVLSDCPAVATLPQSFRVAPPSTTRGRAAHH